MTYAGLFKRAKSHFENCNNCPDETPVPGDCIYILPPRAMRARRPRGPNVKKGIYKTASWSARDKVRQKQSNGKNQRYLIVPRHNFIEIWSYEQPFS